MRRRSLSFPPASFEGGGKKRKGERGSPRKKKKERKRGRGGRLSPPNFTLCSISPLAGKKKQK